MNVFLKSPAGEEDFYNETDTVAYKEEKIYKILVSKQQHDTKYSINGRIKVIVDDDYKPLHWLYPLYGTATGGYEIIDADVINHYQNIIKTWEEKRK